MIFGLTLGVVLFALTDDRKWVGIGIAFGPLIGRLGDRPVVSSEGLTMN